MDAKYLAEIKVREQSATPGEWKIGISSLITDGKGAALFAGKGAKGNADFIAHARTDVPALIAEIELLDEERTVSKMEIVTLKKALELACGKLAINQWSKVTAQEMYDYYIQQAQEQEGKE